MDIDNLTLGDIRQLKNILNIKEGNENKFIHPMIGCRCLIRTYSAGVHIGDVVFAEGMEVKLENSIRLWQWKDGGLSLSAVAANGIKNGRLNKTGNIYLTNVIEMIPVSNKAWDSYLKFIEDDE